MAQASTSPRGLSYHLLEQITNAFSEKLGSGAYGQVYKGVHKDGQEIAVKILNNISFVQDNEQFENEFNNLTRLDHENIVRLVSYCYEIQQEYLVYKGKNIFAERIYRALCFEFMPNGNLEKYLSEEDCGLHWCTRYGIIKGVCMGLKYLHEELDSPFYHLDLKPANILLDKHMIPKIADFGLSKFFGEELTRLTTSSIGTPGYLPPEYIEKNVISNKFDIFSLGVVLIKILAGPNGYSKSADMSRSQFIQIVHEKWSKRLHEGSMYAYSEQVKICIEIALRCVEADRHKRPSIGNIVSQLNEIETSIVFHGLTIDQGSRTDQRRIDMSTKSDTEGASDQKIQSELLGESDQDIESELLDVSPLQLRFPFQPNKRISCLLRISNITDDHHVAFRCTPKTPGNYLGNLSRLQGILAPKSVCKYLITVEMQPVWPENIDALAVILESCKTWEETHMDDNFFVGVREEGEIKVHEVTLTAVSDRASETMTSEPIRPRIEILYCRDSLQELLSMDVHPTKPWIVAGHFEGYVSVWDYENKKCRCTHGVQIICFSYDYEHPGADRLCQETVMAMKLAKREPGYFEPWIVSAKFIARKGWFVAGDGGGYIQVIKCETMTKVEKFQAHKGWVESLSVHPSQPFLLSASDDNLIKLWNWDTNWACIRTFRGHSSNVQQVMFNPHDSNTFASVSKDGTVKIWNISSPSPIFTLECNSDGQMCVDYFSPRSGLNYMITGSQGGIARVWDLRTMRCIRQFKGLQTYAGCSVGVLDCFPDRQVLITASKDHAVSFRNTSTYKYESTIDFGLDMVRGGYIYIERIRSLAIGFADGIALVEID